MLVAIQHVGVCHARNRQVGEGFAPAVAGRCDAHQARIERVLQVALQDAVLDQHRAPRRIAFVVDRQRAAPVDDGAVVDDGDSLGRHALADAAGESRAALAVEVALQPVADRLVEQNARPAGAQHHRHAAGRRRLRRQIDAGLMDGVLGVLPEPRIGEVAVVVAAAAAGVTLLALAVLDHDDREGNAHQRPHIGGHVAIRPRHQHDLPGAGDVRHDLGNARIEIAGKLLQAFEQLHFLRIGDRENRVVRHVERRGGPRRELRQRSRSAGGSDGPRRLRRPLQGRQADLVGVGEGRLVAAHRAHADPLVDAVAARLHDAFFEAPCLGARVLEVEVGIVDAMAEDLAEDGRKLAWRQIVGCKQDVLGCRAMVCHEIHNRLCCRAGRLARTAAIRPASSSATTTPSPLSRRASTSPQGSMIMLLPWVMRPVGCWPPCAEAST